MSKAKEKTAKAAIPEIAKSPNLAEEKKRELAELLPEAFSEGRLDIQALKRALGEESVIEGGERYRLDWAGKSDAYKVLQTPSTATLRPERDKSVNFDAAEHVFIEGENLEVLKVLQKAYFGKVKMIYIDPPYNTGNDSFVYPDRFQESKEDYLKRVNDLADDGTLMREGFFRKNSRENGHYHSNWLNMMLPRLYIARNLLREDGVIFVSCDDNEVHNLRCLMNEVFGDENFISQIIVQSNKRGQTYKDISKTHEYLLAYGRSEEASLFELEKDSEALPYEDSKGKFDLWELRNRNPKFGRHNRPNLFFPIFVAPEIVDENGYAKISLEKSEKYSVEVVPKNSEGKESCWRWSRKKLEKTDIESGTPIVVAKKKKSGEWNIYEKSRKSTTKAKSIWDETEVISEQGTVELGQLGMGDLFDHPKPRKLIEKILRISTEADDLVMDFFAGSATTADALARINATDGTARQLILVQMPEQTEETSNARRSGFRTIADIGRERFRRVLKGVVKNADMFSFSSEGAGFKSYLLSPSNFRQWRGDSIESGEQLADQIKLFTHSEKGGADAEAVLYELLLKYGYELTVPVEALNVEGKRIFSIGNHGVLFVLEDFTEPMIDALLAFKPREVIALDSVFHGTDELKTNFALQCRDADVKFTCI